MALTFLLAVGMVGLILAGLVIVMALCFKKAAPDEALVITLPAGTRKVSFTSSVVYPFLHQLDRVSLREHVIGIDRHGDEALRTRDDHAVELVASFRIRVRPTTADVLAAATAMGPSASDLNQVRDRFLPSLNHALESVARVLTAEEIDRDREAFKDRVLAAIGTDLDGFGVEDLALTGIRVMPGSAYRG